MIKLFKNSTFYNVYHINDNKKNKIFEIDKLIIFDKHTETNTVTFRSSEILSLFNNGEKKSSLETNEILINLDEKNVVSKRKINYNLPFFYILKGNEATIYIEREVLNFRWTSNIFDVEDKVSNGCYIDSYRTFNIDNFKCEIKEYQIDNRDIRTLINTVSNTESKYSLHLDRRDSDKLKEKERISDLLSVIGDKINNTSIYNVDKNFEFLKNELKNLGIEVV